MLYMLKVYLLFSLPIILVAGVALLALTAWSKAKDYVRARHAMRRIARRPAESFRAA